MNEEKKKAIEKLKEAQDRMIKPKMLKDVKYTNEDYAEAIDTILNLIEKQQKEIKRLKDIEADYIRRMKTSNKYLLKQGYISKDKIKDIIESSSYPDFAIQKITELLEEK